MSSKPNNYRLPLQDIYGKKRDNSKKVNANNKENLNNVNLSMQNNAFATPDEDDHDFFGDDDDDLLIAASQQVEMKISNEKDPGHQGNKVQSLQGQVSILKDELEKIRREKEEMHQKHLESTKNTQQQFRKDMNSLSSKLEFKDREMDELKAKITNFECAKEVVTSSHAPKRPRLSTVNTRSSKSVDAHHTDCIRVNKDRLANRQRPRAAASSSFCTLNLKESEECPVHRKLLMLYRGLCNNTAIKHKYNIYRVIDKHIVTQDNTAAIKSLFAQLHDVNLPWVTKELVLQILATVLPYNAFANLKEEIKHVLELLKTTTLPQHDVVCNMLSCTKYNVLSLCTRDYPCPLLALYSVRSISVLQLLQEHVFNHVFSACVCSDKLVQYLCNTLDSCIKGNLFTARPLLKDENVLIITLQVLVSLSPKFADMSISDNTKISFYAILDILKKMPLDNSYLAKIDALYDVSFDLNNSMSME